MSSAAQGEQVMRKIIVGDIADVKRLKEEDGPNLVTQGSTELVHALLANAKA